MKTALFVDDMNNSFKNIHRAVARAGYNVVCVSDGKAALSKVISQRPDIVLMDLIMPEWDGLATAAKIRSMEGCNDVPVLFLSSVIAGTCGVIFGDGVEYPIISKMADVHVIVARIRECCGV
jgi:CheY-like chemotaxis protein